MVVRPSASFGLAVGDLPLSPALVDCQMTEAEFAQPLLLHLLQPLPGRQLLEDLALRRGMPLLASVSGHARELPWCVRVELLGRREVHLLLLGWFPFRADAHHTRASAGRVSPANRAAAIASSAMTVR
ncbi:MAG: hypothetical protein ACK559_03630 [bacterium]